MARSRKRDAVLKMTELQAWLEQAQLRQQTDFSMPLYSPKVLIAKCGITRKSLDNWHAREGSKDDGFVLDADAARGEERNRLYSKRDVLLLSGALNFSALGAPLPVAKRAAKLLVDCVAETRITMSIIQQQPMLIVFRRDDEWWIVPTSGSPEISSDVQERQVPAKVYSPREGTWREETIGERLADAPPLRMVLDVVEFGGRVLANLGAGVALGDASELRRTARKLPKET